MYEYLRYIRAFLDLYIDLTAKLITPGFFHPKVFWLVRRTSVSCIKRRLNLKRCLNFTLGPNKKLFTHIQNPRFYVVSDLVKEWCISFSFLAVLARLFNYFGTRFFALSAHSTLTLNVWLVSTWSRLNLRLSVWYLVTFWVSG